MILLESIFIQVQTEVYSVENGIAKREEAIAWLMNNQNDDGSWGMESMLRDTSEVLKYANESWFTETEVMGDAKEWVSSQKASNYDDIYRINSINQLEQNINITEVTTLQNSDGGWSLNENYASDVLDTLLALEACINAEEIHTDIIKKGVAYLLLKQMENGAFSYADEETNVYLTAYAAYVLEDYTRGMGRNDESAKIALTEAEEYLISCEDATSLWGLDENGMLSTLMTSIVLADDDTKKTYERIEAIAGVIDADGSVYGSPVLTAMFVSLVDAVSGNDDTQAISTEVEELHVFTMDGGEIKSYTDVCFDAEITSYSENAMSLSMVVGTKEEGYETIAPENNTFAWNTGNKDSGNYEVYAIVTEDTTGAVLSVKKKIFNIVESIDVTNAYLTSTPKVYKINSGEKITLDASADVCSNMESTLIFDVMVRDHDGNKVYEDSREVYVKKEYKYIDVQKFEFVPDTKEKSIYYAQLSVKHDEKVVQKAETTIETYSETEEKKIIANYTADRQWVLPEDDEVNIEFDLNGVGNMEEVQRTPMDIVINLDNSLSMSSAAIKKEVEAAKLIIDYMYPEDRGSIIFVSPGTEASEFTSDKEKIKNTVDGIYSKYGTRIDIAIDTAIDLFKKTEEGRKRVLFILSDGLPDDYNKTIDSAKAAVENDITIYTLGMGSVAEKLLIELADIGGGEYMLCETTEELMTVMERMAEELFSVAGTEISFSMKLGEGISIDDITYVTEPDEIIQKDDGTVTVTWNKPYISIGENQKYGICVATREYIEGNVVDIFTDAKVKYRSMAGKIEEVELPDYTVRVKNQYVSSNITTDKDSYITGEDVAITLEAIKEVTDKAVTGVIEITDENGVTVEVIDDVLIVEDKLTDSYVWNTGEVVPGDYKAVISWYRNGKEVDRQEYNFTVIEEVSEEESLETDNDSEGNTGNSETDDGADFVQMKGSISVSDKDVLTGEDINASYNAVNLGTKALQDTSLNVNVISVETQKAEALDEGIHRIDVKATVNGEAVIDTAKLAEGNYLVTLNAILGEEQILLGATGFTVTEPQYSISITSQSGGTANTEMTGLYKENTGIELKATPDEGYIFAGWISDNGGAFENEYSETTTFITPGNDTVVTAMFVKKKYTVTVEAGNGGKLLKEVTGSYEEGTELELEAEAFDGYEFKCWSVSGVGTVKNENSGTTTFTIGDGEAVVTALFTEKGKEETGYNITIQAGTGGKIVAGESRTYTSGTKIDITAVPDEGYSFDYWLVTGAGNVADKNESTTIFTVTDGDAGVKAVFTRIEDETKSGKKDNVTTDSDNSKKSHNTDKTTDKDSANSSIDAVRTGDFGERAVIIRNITIMLFIMVLVSMVVVKKEEKE